MKCKAIRFAMAVALLTIFTAGLACADDKADAVKMVKEAVALYQASGMEKTLDAINDPKGRFTKGQLYAFAFDENGTLVANAVLSNKVGQNLLEVPDSKGKKFRKEFIEVAKRDGSGWVDYSLWNPKTNKEELKTSYVEKAGELVIGCGVYKK
jgi:cytochrome c